MITFMVFDMLWDICVGTGDAVINFTKQQMASAFLVSVASDLNLICNLLRK